jgi:arabinofuranosyltransferase
MRRHTPDVALGLAVLLGAYAGWRLFWFLTDDAFIAFRYASNGVLGHGLVWNPPPFQAVEGYTSFLWVRLLELVWRVTGIEPPRSANWISLAFGYATLWLGIRWLARMSLPPAQAAQRRLFAALVLLGTLTNRTFLTWLSSGLETAMFNFFVTWWLLTALASRRDGAWLLRLSLATALLGLTRPDGLLFGVAWAVITAIHVRESRGGPGPGPVWRQALPAAPMLAVGLHLAWRRWTYGEWLPNTYTAKHVEPWAESGLRYLASFVFEYGVWVWLLLLGAWLARALRRPPSREALGRHRVPAVAIATLALQVGYYSFAIGGDHFEYRVYSHLVLLLFVSAVWLAAHGFERPWQAVAAVAAFVVVSWPIPWTHWLETRALTTRAQTLRMARPIAPRFPAPLRPAVAVWDDWQAWLARRRVCVRHQEHKVFWLYQVQRLPTRSEGSAIGWEQRAVTVRGSVGVPGWVLPEVAVIDEFGLNDRVIARNPQPRYRIRRMAHDRIPPAGYVECFRPNLEIRDGALRLEARDRPLTDDEIRACESRDWR